MKIKKSVSFVLAFLLLFFLFAGDTAICFAADTADEMYAQGMAYFTGDGVEQDIKKGSEMLLAAADAGSIDAMMSLGYFCAYGTGSIIIKDYEKGMDPVYALKWFTRAANEGNADDKETAAYSIIEIGYNYLLGKDERIPEDTVAAVMFFEEAEKLGVYEINDILGIFYTYGSVVDRDPDRALEIFLEGARAGYKECEYTIENYAYAYYAGTDDAIDINFATSFQYYKALTAFNNTRAMYNVGLLYIYGLGVSADRDEGIKWITRAASLGDDRAKEMLETLTAEEKN